MLAKSFEPVCVGKGSLVLTRFSTLSMTSSACSSKALVVAAAAARRSDTVFTAIRCRAYRWRQTAALRLSLVLWTVIALLEDALKGITAVRLTINV